MLNNVGIGKLSNINLHAGFGKQTKADVITDVAITDVAITKYYLGSFSFFVY